jgi:hypothetical protein
VLKRRARKKSERRRTDDGDAHARFDELPITSRFLFSPPPLLFCAFVASGIPSCLLLQPPSARTEGMTLLSCSCTVAKAAPGRPRGAKPVKNDFKGLKTTKRPLPLLPLRPFRPRPSVAVASSPSTQGNQSGGVVTRYRGAGSNSNGFSRKRGRERGKQRHREGESHRKSGLDAKSSSPPSLTSAPLPLSLSRQSPKQTLPPRKQQPPRPPTSPPPAPTTPGPLLQSVPWLWSSSA